MSPTSRERRRRRTPRATRSRWRRTPASRRASRPRSRSAAALASKRSGSRPASTIVRGAPTDELACDREPDVGAAAEHEHRLHGTDRVLHEALRSGTRSSRRLRSLRMTPLRVDASRACVAPVVDLGIHRRAELGPHARVLARGTRARRPRRRARRARRAARRARARPAGMSRASVQPGIGNDSGPAFSCSKRLSTARNDGHRAALSRSSVCRTTRFGSVRHDVLVLQEAARSVDAVPAFDAVERVEELGHRLDRVAFDARRLAEPQLVERAACSAG